MPYIVGQSQANMDLEGLRRYAEDELKKLSTYLTRLEASIPGATDLTGILADIADLQADVATLEGIVTGLQTDVATIQAAYVSSIGGVSGAITLARGLEMSGSVLRRKLDEATLQTTPFNPSGTSSTTGVMMGIGSSCALTPVYSSRIFLKMDGIASNNSGIQNVSVEARYGTGTPPANGAAATGTVLGSPQVGQSAFANSRFTWSVGGIITGLTPGTAYWFDLNVLVSAGTGALTNISCAAMEF